MRKGKTSISQASSYEEIGEFWDTHDLSDYWEQTHPVEFEVDLQSSSVYYRVDSDLSGRLRALAQKRGVSPETLLNLWVQEKVLQDAGA